MIYTIGHSSHDLEAFLGLLEAASIEVLADVRSVPYSRRFPHFSRPAIHGPLAARGITYLFCGRELGARPDDPACYRDGRVDYALIAKTIRFRQGLERVEGEASKYRLALMCAEREPLDCHRTLLVTRHLTERGAPVTHLLSDGSLEPHEVTQRRLLERAGLAEQELFDDEAQRLRLAYEHAARG